MKQRIKRIIISIGLLAVIFIAEATLTFYVNQGGSIDNEMATKGSSVYMQELFDPADYWLPGESKQKELEFGNKGEQDQVIRFRVETQWFSRSGDDWVPTTENPVEIKWTSALTQEWVSFGEAQGWYYYNKILPVGGKTAKVMETVKFEEELSNDSCGEDFTKTTYRIVIYMEALDVSSVITKEKWGKTFIQGEGLDWIE